MTITVQLLTVGIYDVVINDVWQSGWHGTITANGIGGVDVTAYADEDYFAELLSVPWSITFTDGINAPVTETGAFTKDDTRLAVSIRQASLYIDNLRWANPSSATDVINKIPADTENDVDNETTIRFDVVSYNDIVPSLIEIEINSSSYPTTTIYTSIGGFQNGFTGSATASKSPGASVNDQVKFNITPPTPFTSLEVVTMTVRVIATLYPEETHVYSFTIEDLTAPEIEEILWLTPRKAKIKFSEPITDGTNPGEARFNQFFYGGVEIISASQIKIFGATVVADWIGEKCRISGSKHPKNHQVHTITGADTTNAILTVTPADLVVDDGVDRDDLDTILARRDLYLNISNYWFAAQLSLEGASSAENSADKIQCAYEPLITTVTEVPSVELPLNANSHQYYYVTTHDDISISRIYYIYAHSITDTNENTNTDTYLQFTSPRFGVPETHLELWNERFIPGIDQQEDLLGNKLLRKMSVVLQDVLNIIHQRILSIEDAQDPYKCPSHMLDNLLHQFGNPFNFPLETDRMKRIVAANLDKLYSRIGTERGIVDFLQKLLGYTFDLRPLHEEGYWQLNDPYYGKLGITTVLGTSSEYARNSYECQSSVILTEDEERIVRDVCTWADSLRMHLLRITEPGTTYHSYWQLNSGKLGIDTLLGV